jgi:hypothetical protein
LSLEIGGERSPAEDGNGDDDDGDVVMELWTTTTPPFSVSIVIRLGTPRLRREAVSWACRYVAVRPVSAASVSLDGEESELTEERIGSPDVSVRCIMWFGNCAMREDAGSVAMSDRKGLCQELLAVVIPYVKTKKFLFAHRVAILLWKKGCGNTGHFFPGVISKRTIASVLPRGGDEGEEEEEESAVASVG